MKQLANFSYLFFISLILVSCGGRQVMDMEGYQKWLNDPDNGLVKTRYVNGLRLQLKLMPAEYLVMKDYLEEDLRSPQLLDSLKRKFNQNLVFILNIGPDEREESGADIMFAGAQNYQQYKERFLELSFFLEERITLHAGGKDYQPVLTSLENIYGLKADRNVNIAFVPNEIDDPDFYKSEELLFTFEDDVFETGISHFTFSRNDLKNAPLIKI